VATIVTVTLNPAVDRTLEVRNFQPGKVYKGRLRAFRAAGKGVNVSAVLAALGRPSVALGFVGLHEQSFFRASLHPALVDCRLAPIPGVTRHHTTIIDPARHTETHLREEGFEVNETYVRELKRSIGTVLRGGDFCLFSGSLPRGIKARHLVELAAHCAEVGARVIVDGEGDALAAVTTGATGRPQIELIKPNVAELGHLAGASLRTVPQVVAAARRFCVPSAARAGAKGAPVTSRPSRLRRPPCRSVLVSWGERGVYLVTANEVWHARVAVPPNQVANTVGCGDSLLAGFVAGLNDGSPIEACLRLAVACAAADCLTYAAGDVDSDAVHAFIEQAVVERLDEDALARGSRSKARAKSAKRKTKRPAQKKAKKR